MSIIIQKRRLPGCRILAGLGLLAILAGGCKGRTAENMEPTGETVRVEIPTPDVAQDSAIAAGETL